MRGYEMSRAGEHSRAPRHSSLSEWEIVELPAQPMAVGPQQKNTMEFYERY